GGGQGVPVYVVKRMEGMATDLVENYALLKVLDRRVASGALSQLWLSLAGPGQGDNLFRTLSAVVHKGVVRATAMEGVEDVGPGMARGVARGTPRWVAPVDPLTGETDTRLCFLYAEMWREIMDPPEEENGHQQELFGNHHRY
ncbi:unnamed protein product, partial [Choristocarpus tenellus]